MAIQQRILDCFAALAMTVMLLFAAPAAAQQLPERPTTPVLDEARLLRVEQVVDISSKAEALHARTGRTFFVATVKSLNGLTIEDYGNRLARKWQPGSADDDDGVILIVAPTEKKVRIETGYGAEGFLPDILAGRIIRDTIVPRFKAGDLAGGTAAGADAVITQMGAGAEAAKANVDAAERSGAGRDGEIQLIPVIIIVVIFFVIISSIAGATRGRRYRSRRRGGIDPWVVLWGLNEISRASRGSGGWGGGGGVGGFGGGGGGGGSFGSFGGGFGGGGASGSW